MTLSDRSMCMIPHQDVESPLSFLFLIRSFVELRVGNEKKHTCFTYIAKSKTGPNRENRSYNQIKMCMCVEFFWTELAPLSTWLYLFILRYGLSLFFFFPMLLGTNIFSFASLSHSPYSFCNMKSHVKEMEHFCMDGRHVFA